MMSVGIFVTWKETLSQNLQQWGDLLRGDYSLGLGSNSGQRLGGFGFYSVLSKTNYVLRLDVRSLRQARRGLGVAGELLLVTLLSQSSEVRVRGSTDGNKAKASSHLLAWVSWSS